MEESPLLGIEGVRVLSPERAKELFAPFGCEKCGCSISFHASSCEDYKP